MELQSHHLRLLDGAVVANAIVEPSMVLVNSTHIGLLLPNPIVISIRIRFLLNILIVIPISNTNRTLITIDITNRSL